MTSGSAVAEKTVALAGLGAIGLEIARGLEAGIPGLKLVAVSEANTGRAEAILAGFRHPPKLMSFVELATADIVIEALPAAIFDDIAVPVIEAGKMLIPCSVGALLTRGALIERARQTGARIVAPTGAIAGLDAVRAIAQGPIDSAIMESRKPPKGLAGVPYLVAQGIDVETITQAQMVFDGSAADAARHFPANANVAAALALAGIGPERTRVQIWADPATERNTHKILVEAPSARLTVIVENLPSETNPRTSKLAPLSILACLSGLVGTMKVGS